MKLAIVIPTYNEAETIPSLISELFEKIKQLVERLDILIIDDSSPDGTADIARELGAKYEKITVIQRPKKMGLGAAYKEGFRHVLEKFDSELIVQMDADMSHDPMEIPAMLAHLNNHDLVIGSRYIHGVSVVNWPIRRLVLSYGANLYSRIATGMPIKDATGGYKAWSRKVLASIDLDNVKSSGYSFQIEMNFRAWIKGYRLKEHAIIFIDRTIGESKMSRSIMFEAVWMVWRLRIWRIFGWNK